jgi:hypothetical protein
MMPIVNPRQRVLWTLAAVIWIAVLVFSVVSGEFGGMPAYRKGLQILLALLGLYLLWATWARPRAVDPPR